jgi:hypothetical protein
VVSYSTPVPAILAPGRPAEVDRSCRRRGTCDEWCPPAEAPHRRPNGTDDAGFVIVAPAICAGIERASATPPNSSDPARDGPQAFLHGKHPSACSPFPDLGASLVRGASSISDLDAQATAIANERRA